ncbi:hypothetical protein J0H58_22930 [bacterium]|nr:hypothetical protein [bacterium]
MTRWQVAASSGLAAVVLALGAGDPATAQTAKKAKTKAKDALPALNAAVLEFARKNLGEQVGDGECWTLANDALVAAGGKSSPAYRDHPAKGDSVWGVGVYGVTVKDGKATEDATDGKLVPLPGDIVQFRDAKFAGARAGGGTYSMTAPHHTAVVAAASPDGKTLMVLHQNWAGKRTVGEATIKLNDLKEGWVRIYRPQPR